MTFESYVKMCQQYLTENPESAGMTAISKDGDDDTYDALYEEVHSTPGMVRLNLDGTATNEMQGAPEEDLDSIIVA